VPAADGPAVPGSLVNGKVGQIEGNRAVDWRRSRRLINLPIEDVSTDHNRAGHGYPMRTALGKCRTGIGGVFQHIERRLFRPITSISKRPAQIHFDHAEHLRLIEYQPGKIAETKRRERTAAKGGALSRRELDDSIREVDQFCCPALLVGIGDDVFDWPGLRQHCNRLRSRHCITECVHDV